MSINKNNSAKSLKLIQIYENFIKNDLTEGWIENNIIGEEKLINDKIDCFYAAEENVLYTYIKNKDTSSIKKNINIFKNINSKNKFCREKQESIFKNIIDRLKEENLYNTEIIKIVNKYK